MGLNLEWLDIKVFFFLFNFILNFVNDLVKQIVDMSASFWRTNSIHKGNLFELTISDWNDDLPSISVDLAIEDFLRWRILVEIHVNVFWEGLDIDFFFIQGNFDFRQDACHVMDSFGHKGEDIFIEAIFHVEKFEAGIEGDRNKIFAAVRCDFGPAMHFHVVIPDHFELFLVFRVSTLNYELFWENVGQLGAITISTTDDSFFIVVVIATCEQMTKDEFWDEYFMLFMDNNWDSFPVVHHSDVTFFLVYFHIELVHFLIALVVVCSVDENFVKDFVESGCVCDFLTCESGMSFRKDPLLLLTGLNCANIGVRTEKDVFEGGLFLVDFLDCLFFLHLSQFMFYKDQFKIAY